MSLRTSRRAAAAAGGASMAATVAAEVPSVPVAEIRSRKWTKQLKTVGHLTILKWVPDQETPTLALQRGVFKKTKGGRKRQVTGEIGRMTRSVRQHLDAPLELLSELPVPRNHGTKQPASALIAAPAIGVLASAATAATPLIPSSALADAVGTAAAALAAPASGQTSDQTSLTTGLEAAPGDPMLPTTVPSDEQLEMALDDLPMLDSDEDLPFDSLVEDQVPPAVPVRAEAPTVSGQPEAVTEQPSAPTAAPVDESVENTAESTAEGDDDDDDASSSSSSGEDDDNDNASANSGSPMPSPSPQSSPMMSRSPSP